MPGLSFSALRSIIVPGRTSGGAIWSRVHAVAGNPHFRWVLGVGALAGLYYGSAQLGFWLGFSGPVAAIVWLPVGVGIAFLYVGRLIFWPGVLLGDLLANDYSAIPVWSALAQTVGNILEVVVAVVIIRRLVRRGSPLETVHGVVCTLLALVAGTLLSATIGALSLLEPGVVSASEFPSVWRTWLLGDFSGALVVVPLVLAWYGAPIRHVFAKRQLEAALMLVATAGISELAFRTDEPLVFVAFPALIWAALRFGPRGATLCLAVTAGVVVWNTTHYSGPFAFHSITRSTLTAQLFIATAALLTLSVAAVVAERERAAESLAASRIRLVEAADGERRRIERNLHDGSQQRLTSLVARMHAAGEELGDAPSGFADLFAETEQQLVLAIEELRELAHGIHPATLRDFGLAKALQDIAARAGVRVELVELPARRVDAIAESTAYYVVAEAVANAQRHASASVIRVRAVIQGPLLEVEVADDGVGGALEAHGSGLEGLRDRVEAVGGTFELRSMPGRGTRILAVIPTSRMPPWSRMPHEP